MNDKVQTDSGIFRCYLDGADFITAKNEMEKLIIETWYYDTDLVFYWPNGEYHNEIPDALMTNKIISGETRGGSYLYENTNGCMINTGSHSMRLKEFHGNTVYHKCTMELSIPFKRYMDALYSCKLQEAYTKNKGKLSLGFGLSIMGPEISLGIDYNL